MCILSMAVRIMLPSHGLILIPGSWDYVALHGKGDFTDVIKMKDLEMERVSRVARWV